MTRRIPGNRTLAAALAGVILGLAPAGPAGSQEPPGAQLPDAPDIVEPDWSAPPGGETPQSALPGRSPAPAADGTAARELSAVARSADAAAPSAAPSRTPAEARPDPLSLRPGDVRIEQSIEGGYYLYVRQTGGIGSILITESTEAPDHSVATYAFRNPRFHPENGNERRMLDGEFLERDGHYSLIDSTPVDDDVFDEAFRVFIPYVVVYGYPWTRSGELQVLDGAYLSIRTFERPYADYSGGYRDNPFVLRVMQRPVTERPEYMPEAVERLREIAEENGGDSTEGDTDEDVVATIERLLEEVPGRSIDLVLALDTTQSMEDNVPYLREHLVPMLERQVAGREFIRVGLVFYRDYMEEYLTRRVNFQNDLEFVQRSVDTIRVAGGRDIPEAVYEALYTAVTRYIWQADERLVVLVGDAPPHPRPRGAVTRELVQSEAARRNVRIHTIILPQ